MHDLILWCGFLGAWLLVAGPVFQATLELQAEEIESDRIRSLGSNVSPPPSISIWWWLLPPVAFFLERARRNRYQHMIVDSLTDEEFQALTNYVNKATAWLYVGVGGLLIAVKETYELTHDLEWPIAVFWVLLVVMTAISVGNAVARDSHTKRETARRAAKSTK